jgi:hypothetical protein
LICLYICFNFNENFVIDLTELTTIPQDDHALHALETEETEQVGFNCCGHSGKYLVTSFYPYIYKMAKAHHYFFSSYLPCLHTLADSSVCSGVIPVENSCANYEEQMVLHSTNDPVGVTVHGLHLVTF